MNAAHAAVTELDLQAPPAKRLRLLRDALRLLWSSADPFAKRRLAIALACVVGAAVSAALAPLALKLLVDALSRSSSPAAPEAVALTLFYVLAQYVVRCAAEARTFAFGMGEQRLRRRIGAQLFAHLVALPLSVHLERKVGAMSEASEQGLRGCQLLLNHFVHTILPAAVELVAVAVVLLNFGHAKYLVILALAAAAYVAAFQRGAADIRVPAQSVSQSHIEAHAVLTDSLSNYEAVKYCSAEPLVCARYDQALGCTESAWRRFFARRAANGLIVAAIFAVSLCVAMLCAVQDVARGAMTIGGFVLVNAYVLRLVQPLEMLGAAVRDAAQGLAFLEKLLELFREQRERDVGNGRTAAEARGELSFEDVSFSYRRGRPVLRNVTFRVAPGRTVAVVGVSGSGKSSLIRLLFRLYEPDSGRILLDGIPIEETPLPTLRQAIAVVPQDTMLLHDTIARNIGFGRCGSTRPEIEEAARIANLHEFILGLPDGYETVVGERGLKLSGGERQRIAIARAALKRPRLFVFDEATSSLDSTTEQEILGNLKRLASNATTLVIAHRLSTIVHADEILVLDRGAVVERGCHAELLAREGRYATLWRAQHAPGRS